MTIFDSARLILRVPMVEGSIDWDERRLYPAADLTGDDIQEKFSFHLNPLITPDMEGHDDVFDAYGAHHLQLKKYEFGFRECIEDFEPGTLELFIGFTSFDDMSNYLAYMYYKETRGHPLSVYSRLY